jgi:hypothetical protein
MLSTGHHGGAGARQRETLGMAGWNPWDSTNRRDKLVAQRSESRLLQERAHIGKAAQSWGSGSSAVTKHGRCTPTDDPCLFRTEIETVTWSETNGTEASQELKLVNVDIRDCYMRGCRVLQSAEPDGGGQGSHQGLLYDLDALVSCLDVRSNLPAIGLVLTSREARF